MVDGGWRAVAVYDVVRAGPPTPFLACYAATTGLPVREENGGTRLGPLLSAYEAAWLAWSTTGARVEQLPAAVPSAEVPDGAALLAAAGSPAAAGLEPDADPAVLRVVAAASVPVAGLDLRRLRWSYPGGVEQVVDYRVDAAGWHPAAAHPVFDDPYIESFGLAVLDAPDGPRFLRPVEWARGSGTKEEAICLAAGDEAGCPIPGFAVSALPGGPVVVRAVRLRVDPDGLAAGLYEVVAASRGEGGELGVGASGWRAGRPGGDGAGERFVFGAGRSVSVEFFPWAELLPGSPPPAVE